MSNSIDEALLSAFERDRAGESFEVSVFDLNHAEMWVRLGVSDPRVSERIFERCVTQLQATGSSLTQETALRLGLSLHYIRSLGARHLLNEVLESLTKSCELDEGESITQSWYSVDNPLFEVQEVKTECRALISDREASRDKVSAFQAISPFFADQTLGSTALQTIALLSTHNHPARILAINHVSTRLQSALRKELSLSTQERSFIQAWLWDQADWERDLSALLPMTSTLLNEKRSRVDLLAIRLALLSPKNAVQVCESLGQLEIEVKRQFTESLEKQLKRVGKVSLWVQCRETLKRG